MTDTIDTIDTIRYTTDTLCFNSNTQKTQCRQWLFTLNNYSDKELATIDTEIQRYSYIYGFEIGEQNTPHLQGFIKAKNPIKFSTLKKMMPRAHLEKAVNTTMANVKYCMKDGNFKTNIDVSQYETRVEKILKAEYNNITWKNWQNNILSLIKSKPDNRKIHWYYDYTGNIGKSYLFKYICLTNNNIIIADGKKDNIFNQINTLLTNNKEPEIILLDVPRTNEDYFNYGAIEQIKNGCIYSGKYEGGVCLFKIPHIIIFANFEPDLNKWSEDRYDITHLTVSNE